MSTHPGVLFSAATIASRVEALAQALSGLSDPPQRLAPVLTGAFIFAADLGRALARKGLDLPLDWLWLASYGSARSRGAIKVRAAPGAEVLGQHVLIIDGVLDSGHTLARAIQLVRDQGARKITTAVVIDKHLPQALLRADHACFAGVDAFVAGYGMDDRGVSRGLGDIISIKAD